MRKEFKQFWRSNFRSEEERGSAIGLKDFIEADFPELPTPPCGLTSLNSARTEEIETFNAQLQAIHRAPHPVWRLYRIWQSVKVARQFLHLSKFCKCYPQLQVALPALDAILDRIETLSVRDLDESILGELNREWHVIRFDNPLLAAFHSLQSSRRAIASVDAERTRLLTEELSEEDRRSAIKAIEHASLERGFIDGWRSFFRRYFNKKARLPFERDGRLMWRWFDQDELVRRLMFGDSDETASDNWRGEVDQTNSD